MANPAHTPEQFKAHVYDWAWKAKSDTVTTVQVFVQDLNEEIIARWPVKTGFSRGSWFASLNGIPQGQGGVGRDPSYQLAIVATKFKLGDVYRVGNTAVYARRLEYGFVGTDSLGRSYNQQGRYVVRSVMLRAEGIALAAAARVAAGYTGSTRPGGGGALPDVGFTT